MDSSWVALQDHLLPDGSANRGHRKGRHDGRSLVGAEVVKGAFEKIKYYNRHGSEQCNHVAFPPLFGQTKATSRAPWPVPELSQGRSAAKRAVRRWRPSAMDSYASTAPLRRSQGHLASGPQPSPSTHTGNAASCPACTPTLAVPSEPPLAHRQCLPRTTRSTVPWSHSCLRQRC